MPRKPAYPKRITLKMLRNRNACDEQIEQFAEMFPDGFEVNRANLTQALEANLEYDWALEEFLSNQPFIALHSQIEQIKGETWKGCSAAGKARDQAAKENNQAIPDHLRDQPDSPKKKWEIADYRQQKYSDIQAEYHRRHVAIHHDEAINIAGVIADFLQLP